MAAVGTCKGETSWKSSVMFKVREQTGLTQDGKQDPRKHLRWIALSQ